MSYFTNGVHVYFKHMKCVACPQSRVACPEPSCAVQHLHEWWSNSTDCQVLYCLESSSCLIPGSTQCMNKLEESMMELLETVLPGPFFLGQLFHASGGRRLIVCNPYHLCALLRKTCIPNVVIQNYDPPPP